MGINTVRLVGSTVFLYGHYIGVAVIVYVSDEQVTFRLIITLQLAQRQYLRRSKRCIRFIVEDIRRTGIVVSDDIQIAVGVHVRPLCAIQIHRL